MKGPLGREQARIVSRVKILHGKKDPAGPWLGGGAAWEKRGSTHTDTFQLRAMFSKILGKYKQKTVDGWLRGERGEK